MDTLWHGANLDSSSLPNHISNLVPGDREWQIDGSKKAAVAVLFAACDMASSTSHLILTRRTTTVGSHKGQIAFAGGRADATDPSPGATAIRETEEELGIPREKLHVHGTFPATKSIDGSVVIPVLVTTDVPRALFNISTEEVDYVISTPWTQFQRETAETFDFKLFGNTRTSHLYRCQYDRVWGLTARIIYQANFS